MQEVDQIENLKPEWICKPGTDDQIQNDTDQKDCDNCIDNLFEEVQKVGAVCTEQAKIKSNADTIIKLWKNGFTVNDGDLRSYTDVANQHFLDSIKKGQVRFYTEPRTFMGLCRYILPTRYSLVAIGGMVE